LHHHFLNLKYKKVFFYAGMFIGVILISLILSVFLFKDKIIRQFIAEANKHLNTPVTVKKIDVSAFRNFPYLAIVLTDVYVEDSHPGNYPLLTAEKISFTLNPFEVYRGSYIIRGLAMEGGEANLKIDENGITNYAILKTVEKDAGSGALALELNDVKLYTTRVAYLDLNSRQHYIFQSSQLAASIRAARDIYYIAADGNVTTETISVEGKSFLTEKTFDVKSEIVYDDNSKEVEIKPSQLKLRKATFSVSGSYGWKETNKINLSVNGKNTDIQTLLSLLPEGVSAQLERYRSEGQVYFSALLAGEYEKGVLPSLNLDFGFRETRIFHPDYRSVIESASMKGTFSTANLADARKFVLKLEEIRGALNKEPFIGTFEMRDFTNPYVVCSFKGNIDAGALYGFYPLEQIANVAGRLFADVSFRGKIELLKNKATAQQVSTQGSIELNDISLVYGKDRVSLSGLKGSLQFSNNDLALSNVSGKFGNSDFLFNGFFKNIITFLLFENHPVGIETDLKSNFLDINQLLNIGYGAGSSEGESAEYEFTISKNVFLNFNCDVKKLVYKKFSASDVKGDLLVKNKVAVSRKLSLKTMGGDVTMSGIVDASNTKAIDVVCSSKLGGIHLDSVFYVFENFDQDFIKDEHLKGEVTADVDLEMTLNQNLRLYQETLVADIRAVIARGELNNFEPMKKLNRFLDDEGLSRLRFSDLQNEIHIEKKTIYIPQMEIRSNVTNIRISGTHTFDQLINYRLVTPLRGKKKFTDQQAEGAVDNDDRGQTRLFLKITGTTSDYKIAFDTEAIKKKIVDDIKKEFRDLKGGLKNRETQKKKELELQEDEYFDW
jgi:hypothetical protein